MASLTRIFLVAALLCQTGTHLAFLQSAAWSGMALDHWRTTTLKTAISRTFDGRHPCGLCLKVQKDAQGRKTQDSRAQNDKLDLYFAAARIQLGAISFLWILRRPSETGRPMFPDVDLPPPRSLQS